MSLQINYSKWIKLVIGTILSCAIAKAMGLSFYASTGIITLLTIQDTKRETLMVSAKRLIIFVVMTVFSLLVYPFWGFHIWAFGLILIPYLFVCLSLKMPEAIAPIAVLCTHYMSAESIVPSMILNEFLILLVGVFMGVILNLFMGDNTHKVVAFQKQTDEKISHILYRMSIYIMEKDRSEYSGSCFQELSELFESLEKEAKLHMNNHVINSEDYFLQYMHMRKRQCVRLREMYEDIMRMQTVEEEAKPISEFLKKIAKEFSEENDVENLLSELGELIQMYRDSVLPETRDEFETRALLYDILCNIKGFLEIKQDFMESIQKEQE